MSNQLIKSKPDFNRLLKVITRSGTPDRVPFYEIFSQKEQEALDYIKKHDPDFEWFCKVDGGCDEKDVAFRRTVSYMYALGYDYCGIIPDFDFIKSLQHSDEFDRDFLTAGDSMIKNRDDFKAYPWPDAAAYDYSMLKNAGEYLPEGMKIVLYSRGPHLCSLYLLGYEGICYLLADDEALVKDVINTAGECIYEFYAKCAKLDTIGALSIGEDLAFFNGTYLSPKTLRKLVFPWYKKITDVCHANNKPIIYHSCGNNERVMEDLIECGFDAKHSHEDKIMPVWEFKKRWGDRLGVMGGFDMHKLCTMNTDEIKKHVAFLCGECMPGGGWALGAGNSVADYIPLENFITMLTEGFLLGRY